MKITRLIVAFLFLLPFTSSAELINIAIGDDITNSQAQLHKVNAIDITPQIELDRPDKGAPQGSCWNVGAYKCVIALSVSDGKITNLSYWTEKDFSQSKVHREASRLYTQSVAFNLTNNRVSVNLLPCYNLYGWTVDSQNWNFSLLDGSVSRNRTIEEIQDPESRLVGVGTLENRLSKLPVKTVIFLSPIPNQFHSRNSYPSQTVIKELRRFSASKDLKFQEIRND